MKTFDFQIYKNKKDRGELDYGVNWWFNPNIPNSFSIFNLDSFYPEEYFKKDHVNKHIVKNYVSSILKYGKLLLKHNIRSVLELGCGSGWFTKEFVKRKIDIYAIEGSRVGYEKTKKRLGLKYGKNIIKHDLRLPINLRRKFDMAVCTEVAEHIEPPFSDQLVKTLIDHSDLIWFSFEKPLTNKEHYHHSNEQPEKFWKNLFQFYDYEMLKLPRKVIEEVEHRGGYIFYRKRLNIPQIVLKNRQMYNLNKQNIILQNQKNTNIIRRVIRKIKSYISQLLFKISDKFERLANKISY